jgi:hypothetical protein
LTNQIKVGDVYLFALMRSGVLKRRLENGYGGWTVIPPPADLGSATMTIVAVGDTSLWIVDSSGIIRSCQLPCADGGASFKSVDGAPKGIIGLDAGKFIAA